MFGINYGIGKKCICVHLDHNFEPIYRTVQTERKQHHEEDERPERAARHRCNSRRIHDEHQTRALGGHFVDILARCMSHVAKHREDNEARTEAGHRVDYACQNGVSANGLYVTVTDAPNMKHYRICITYLYTLLWYLLYDA